MIHLQAYTVEQVAEMLHVGRDKVYYLLRTGQLRSIKIGSSAASRASTSPSSSSASKTPRRYPHRDRPQRATMCS